MLIKLSEPWHRSQTQAERPLGDHEQSLGPGKSLLGPAGGSNTQHQARRELESPVQLHSQLIGHRVPMGLQKEAVGLVPHPLVLSH